MRAVALLVAVAACGGSATPPAAPHAPPTVTLLDPGAMPRQRVRFELTESVSERVEMTTKMYVSTTYENTVLERGQTKVEMPMMHAQAHLDAKADASGVTVVTIGTDAITVDDDGEPSMRRVIEGELARTGNIHGTWRRSATGVVSDVSLTEDGNGARGAGIDNLSDAIDPAMIVFPDEEIGVGATWKVRAVRKTGRKMVWNQTMTCKLLSLEAGVATVDVSIASRAGEQALKVEPTRSRKVTSGSATSSGQVIVPLHGIVPTATIRGTGEVNFLVVDHARRISTTVTTDSVWTINPARSPDQASSNSATTGR